MNNSFKSDIQKNMNSSLVTWLLVAVMVISGFFAVITLRSNYLTMIGLRKDVIEADKTGEGLKESIEGLGNYVISHMNTDMKSSIELPNSFNRDYDKLVEGSEELTAEQYISVREGCVNFVDAVEVQSQCIRNEANKITDIEVYLPSALYSFNFEAPVWSPDKAGFLVLITGVCALILLLRFIAETVVKVALRHHR